MEPLGGEHHASLHQLFVVLPHFGKELLVRENARLGVLVGFDQHHESHLHVLLFGLGSEPGLRVGALAAVHHVVVRRRPKSTTV